MTDKELIETICKLRILENEAIEKYANEHPNYEVKGLNFHPFMQVAYECQEEYGVFVDGIKLAHAISDVNKLRKYKEQERNRPYPEKPWRKDPMDALCERLGVPNNINMRDFGY